MEMLGKAIDELRLVFSEEELRGLVNEVVKKLTDKLRLVFIDLGLEDKFDEFLRGEFRELPENWHEIVVELVLSSMQILALELVRGILFWEMNEKAVEKIAGVLYLLNSIWLELVKKDVDVLEVIKWLSGVAKE